MCEQRTTKNKRKTKQNQKTKRTILITGTEHGAPPSRQTKTPILYEPIDHLQSTKPLFVSFKKILQPLWVTHRNIRLVPLLLRHTLCNSLCTSVCFRANDREILLLNTDQSFPQFRTLISESWPCLGFGYRTKQIRKLYFKYNFFHMMATHGFSRPHQGVEFRIQKSTYISKSPPTMQYSFSSAVP